MCACVCVRACVRVFVYDTAQSNSLVSYVDVCVCVHEHQLWSVLLCTHV